MIAEKPITRRLPNISPARQPLWQHVRRSHWMVGGFIAIAFALGHLVEALLLQSFRHPAHLILDVVGWGVLGGLAVWFSMAWARRQEVRHQADIKRALHDQQRVNGHLALLRNVNHRIAGSANLDEILDSTLAFPQQLVPARAAALVLFDPSGPITTRVEGISADMLVQLREAFGAALIEAQRHNVRQITVTGAANSNINTCLIVPLRDGTARIGWIELYLERPVTLATDEQALLETIAGEIAEAVVSARRRSREERAIYELERAIADERARIARDIHDGLAQTLAFRRMRVDLWLQWLADDPQRVREELVDLKDTLRDQITELRRAIFALRPIQFDTLGFAGGLHRYIVEFANQHGWDAQVDLGAVPSALSPEIEATCFRIVQESLTNAAKHARATQIIVVIDHIDDGLAVVVRDNGRGFAPGESSREPANRIGLRQMRERLAAIHGQLTLLSHPGGGTEVRAWIPLRTIDTRGGCHDISATALSRRSPHLSSGPA